ncbi:MAG: SH3 domain-containing protein [Dehalococcoidia bacterium]
MPAPFDADLFSFGRLHLYNRRTRRWFSANIAADGGPDHLDPWSAGHEMVFALPHAGHDGVLGLHMLAPRYAQPPFDDTLAFRVEVDPGGLTLRTQPDAASTAVTILYDGELLYLAESPDPSLGPGESSVHEAGDALWLYIRAESGHEGWGEQYVGGVDLGRRSFVDKTPGTFAVAS